MNDPIRLEATPQTGQPLAASDELELRELAGKFWRQKWIVLATVTLGIVLTIKYLSGLIPLYTAEATIMLDKGGTTVVELGDGIVAGMSNDSVESDIQIITSRGLAEKIVGNLNLYGEIQPEQSPWYKQLFTNALSTLGVGMAEEPPKGDEPIEKIETPNNASLKNSRIERFLENLSVEQKGASRAIGVQFVNEDPFMAAMVANTLADFYIVDQLEAKFEAIQRANHWLSKRVDELQKKVESSEQAIEVFRKKSGLVSAKGTSLASDQLTGLNQELILARTDRIEAEARLRHTKELIQSEGGIEFASDVLQSQLIQTLREEEMLSDRRLSEIKRRYREYHPDRSNKYRNAEKDLRMAMKKEVKAIVKGFENEVSIAKAREQSLQESLNLLKDKVSEFNKSEVRLRALEREADANRSLLHTFMARFKQTSSQDDIEGLRPDARIISRAHSPQTPSSPNPTRIIAVGLVGSLLIAVLLVFLIEHLMDFGFRSGEQIEQIVGTPVLGLVPKLSRLKNRHESPESHIVDHPASAFGEAIRTVYAGIHFSRLDNPPKKVLITSSQPNEGKTVITACLAKMQARAGRKVVVVDTDFRRPGLSHSFGMPVKPGLIDLLAKRASLEEVCRYDEPSGVVVIPSGASGPHPPDILASDQLSRLLDTLAKTFDLVLLDSPPVMAVSDARILSQKVDTTVFVIQWAKTRRKVALLGLRQIEQSGARVAGTVLSMVNPKKHAQYSFGDSGYYSAEIKKYHAADT